MRSTNAADDPAMCSATATAASFADAIMIAFSSSPSGNVSPAAATAAALRVALIPNYLGAASRRHSPSASECDERFVAPDELLRIGADHVSAPVELAVHQEPPDVAGAPQERAEARARHPLRDVAAPVDEIAPHRADGRVA